MNDPDRDMIKPGTGGANDSPRHTENKAPDVKPPRRRREIGGRDGPEPTRYGDWEYKGRCIDF